MGTNLPSQIRRYQTGYPLETKRTFSPSAITFFRQSRPWPLYECLKNPSFLFEKWPLGMDKYRNSWAFWKDLLECDSFWMPVANKPKSTIRVCLGILQALLYTVGAPDGFELVIFTENFERNPMETTVRVSVDYAADMIPPPFRHKECFGLTADELCHVMTSSHCRVFALAFAVFVKRGARRINRDQMDTIIKTAVLHKLMKTLDDVEYLTWIVERCSLCQSEDLDVILSFAATFMLANEYFLLNFNSRDIVNMSGWNVDYITFCDVPNCWSIDTASRIGGLDFNKFGHEVKEAYDSLWKELNRFVVPERPQRAESTVARPAPLMASNPGRFRNGVRYGLPPVRLRPAKVNRGQNMIKYR